MGYGMRLGKYQVGKTIGEGTFAKVKVASNTETGQTVAVKILDKKMVIENKLMHQVKREISAMKLLNHPNIVRIYEVIATKSKIYIIMEYVSGGQLSDKMSYPNTLSEKQARKYFQQLIDAVDCCHSRGIYHRDIKPENLLIDSMGNLLVSDFGLSALRKPGEMLSTACGSPFYVAPEVIFRSKYDGAAADIWSCGVILFEMLSGFLPFEEKNTSKLYKKISVAEFRCPEWLSPSQRKLISRLLEPRPKRRAKLAEILEDEWFRTDYKPAVEKMSGEDMILEDVYKAFDELEETLATDDSIKIQSPSFINAFQLIAMSKHLDLSGLFEEQKTKLGSTLSMAETLEKIEVAARDARLFVERMNSSKVKLHAPPKLRRSTSEIIVSAEVIAVTPTNCMIEISRSSSTGEIRLYREFCRSLSSILKER